MHATMHALLFVHAIILYDNLNNLVEQNVNNNYLYTSNI